MTPMDAEGDENRHLDRDAEDADAHEGAVAVETETGLLVYEPGRPDAWIHADCERDVTE
ncbi:hypothetical protein [Natronoarchaeum rubrum]|uniref:hypothetical protein n=1 Tax=Natronoarchaeum rubrum TaxID=755311 RepID=UPI0021136676|nr:hypothetical protein [Natronoarchaeum rubrum]